MGRIKFLKLFVYFIFYISLISFGCDFSGSSSSSSDTDTEPEYEEKITYKKITPEDKSVSFYQIVYTFDRSLEKDKRGEWSRDGFFVIDAEKLKEDGFVQVVTNLGWVVQNIPISSGSEYKKIAVKFKISEDSDNTLVTNLKGYVVITSNMIDSVPKEKVEMVNWDVLPYTYNAESRDKNKTYSLFKEVTLNSDEFKRFKRANGEENWPFHKVFEKKNSKVLEDKYDKFISKNFNICFQKRHFNKNIQAADFQCGPASVANSLSWLNEIWNVPLHHSYSLGLGEDGTLVGQLDKKMFRGFVDRRIGSGVNDINFLVGKLNYLLEERICLVVKHQSSEISFDMPVGLPPYELNSYSKGPPSFEFICEEICKGEDVEVGYMYTSGGGHWEKAIGCGHRYGIPFLILQSDLDQNDDTRGTEFVRVYDVVDVDNNGTLNLVVKTKQEDGTISIINKGEIDIVVTESPPEAEGVDPETVCPWLADESSSTEDKFDQPVIVSFTAKPIKGESPLEVTFTCNAIDPDGYDDIVLFKWDFGDGTERDSSVHVLTYTYNTPGTYQVKCSAIDSKAQIASAYIVIKVNKPPQIISLIASPESGDEPLLVNFTCKAKDDDGRVIGFEWDLDGDSVVDLYSKVDKVELDPDTKVLIYQNSLNKLYDSPGVYKVYVRAKDNDGSKSEFHYVEIEVNKREKEVSFLRREISTIYNGMPIISIALESLIGSRGSGGLDIAAITSGDGLEIWINNGGGNFTKQEIEPGSAPVASNSKVKVKDLNGDNKPDIIGAFSSKGKVIWYENLGNNQFQAHTVKDSIDNVSSIVVTDLNKDNNPDLLFGSSKNNVVIWAENKGGGSFIIHEFSVSKPFSISAGDLDGDGDKDFVVTTFNSILWYENDENGNFSQHILADNKVVQLPNLVKIDDLNGDNMHDVVASYYNGSQYVIAIFENQGSGNFTDPVSFAQFTSPVADIFLIDIDLDNDKDILVATGTNGKMIWYENNGGGNFIEHVLLENMSSANTISAADIDNDGDIDIVTGGNDPKNYITLWENQ